MKKMFSVKSEFVKNVITIFSGVSFAQFFPILISPVLTRIYDPADFAILGLFVATAVLFANISTLSYDQAIMLPKDKEDAVNLYFLSLIMVTIITVISFFVVVLFNSAISALLKNPNISFWLYLVPAYVFLNGTFKVLNIWNSRNKKFKRLAYRNILQSGSTGITKLIFGFFNLTKSGLIIGTLVGQGIATTLLFVQTSKEGVSIKDVSLKRMKYNAIRYKNFPLFTNWQSFTDVVNISGSRFIISSIFGATILGWYSFTMSLLQRPLQLIGQSVSQVFYQRIVQNYNENLPIWPLIKKILIRLLLVGVFIFLPIILAGPFFFKLVFGANWEEAGRYAQFMAPWLLGRFIISPISSVPMVVNKQAMYFLFTLFSNFLIPLSFLLFGMYYDSIYLAFIFNSAFFLLYVLFFVFWLKRISIKVK